MGENELTDNHPTKIRPVIGVLGTLAILIAILAGGAALRFTNLNWDDGSLLHPDDRFMSWVTADISFTQQMGYERQVNVDSIKDYFDTLNTTLNPNNVGHGFYVYGDLPVILTRAVAERAEIIANQSGNELVNLTTLYETFKFGRAMAALCDWLTILFVFLAARHLFDNRVGLLTAGLYAFAAFPIQQSHFFTADTFANVFAMAAFWFATRAFTAHRWMDYPLFGLMLGFAMASKISVAPMALVLIAALILRVWREAQDPPERIQGGPGRLPLTRLASRASIGLVIAGIVTVLAFRVAMPHAFLPAGSPYPIDATDLGGGLAAISRILNPVGFRPNPDWLRNMREVRFQVSGYADIPPNHQWAHRPALIFPWLNMVRVGMGWPLGVFAWLSLLWALWEIARNHRGSQRLVLPVVWSLLVFMWQGIGWVTTMRYFLPIYGTLLMLAAWAMVTLSDRVTALIEEHGAPRWHWSRWLVTGLSMAVTLAGAVWGFAVYQIYTRPHTRVEASEWIFEHVPSDITLVLETEEGLREYQLGLWNDWPSATDLPGNDITQPAVRHTYLEAETTVSETFTLPYNARLIGVRLHRVVDPLELNTEHRLDLRLTSQQNPAVPLAEETIAGEFTPQPDDPRGRSYWVDVEAVALQAETQYRLELQPGQAGPLVISGGAITTEDTWDDALPLPGVAPVNIWNEQYQGYTLMLHWQDIAEKRQRLQYILDRTDYIVISSNRFYATLNRNPRRWPMTIAYYEALFNGNLGFELVADFTSRPNLGPIRFKDDTAEEAWTVYDHPRVFIFKKTDDYSPEQTAAVLNSVDLNEVVPAVAIEATGHPVDIPLPRTIEPGTTRGRLVGAADVQTEYDPTRTDFWSRVQPLTVVFWWLAIWLVGAAAFPLLWTIFPGLPDRGYPLARTAGLLLVAYLAWLAASLNLLPWTGGTVLLALLAVGGISASIMWLRRTELLTWLRHNQRHIIIVETGMAALFLLFILIRLGNPDLWHPVFGGEKPMDLAYFNAVLNSRTFPPYDPWFAGETINYYYFGFVIVGAPLKVLGIPPTLAYNLLIPTVFALTGAGAYSAAFNLVARDDHPLDAMWSPYLAGIASVLLAVVLGNLDQIRTILWGLAELGSGTPEWAITYFPNIGEVVRGLSMTLRDGHKLPVGIGEWYWNATRVIPVPIQAGVPMETGPITEFPYFTFLYADLHAHMIAMPLTLLAISWSIAQVRNAALVANAQNHGGLGRRSRLTVNLLLGGLVIGALRPTNTWDYPTYLALGIGVVIIAHYIKRSNQAALPALVIGGLGAVTFGGAIFAAGINSPDGSSLLLAGAGAVVGLLVAYGIGLGLTGPDDEKNSPLSYWTTLIGGGLQAAIVAGASVLLFLSYIRNYTVGYDRVVAWEGSKTPLWAYLDILGLFLFVIGTWFVIEVYNWLKGRINRRTFVPLLIGLGLLVGATLLASSLVSPVAVVAVPLMAAALALFLQPEQSTSKRLALALILGALALSLVVELVKLYGDIDRMNSVFKFYLQVWLLLAVAAGAAFGWVWPRVDSAHDAIRLSWSAVLGVLVMLSALYSVLAAQAKVADRWNPDAPTTLQGMAFMPTVRWTEGPNTPEPFSLEGDYEALRWLQDNVEGSPVVLEGLSFREYLWGSRVSVYTGLPSVVGWNWHQRQQRPPSAPDVMTRHADVAGLYNTTDIQIAIDLLRQYNVDMVYVGDLERAYYDAGGLAKFDQMVEDGVLRVLYDRKGTTIYEVIDGDPIALEVSR